MDVSSVVMKLVGPVRPVGDSMIDADRLENLRKLCEVAENLVAEIIEVAESWGVRMASVKEARDMAATFLAATAKEIASAAAIREPSATLEVIDADIPGGWRLYTTDASIPGKWRVLLTRDEAETRAWHALSEEEKDATGLFVSGVGSNFAEAMRESIAAARASPAQPIAHQPLPTTEGGKSE